MHDAVSLDAISRAVKGIGGWVEVKGEDVVALFGDPSGWMRECTFTRGPGKSILIREHVISSMRYGGSGSRLSPSAQQGKPIAEENTRVFHFACEAMLVHKTRANGVPVEEVREAAHGDSHLHRLSNQWGLLECEGYFGFHPYTDFDQNWLLIRDGLIYIPLADS